MQGHDARCPWIFSITNRAVPLRADTISQILHPNHQKTNISNLSQIDAPPSHNLQTTLSKTNVIFVNMRPLYSVVGFDYLSRLPRLASHWLSAWHPPDPTQDPLPPWMEHRIWLLARCVTTILRSRSLISLC